jgi:cytochrome P450
MFRRLLPILVRSAEGESEVEVHELNSAVTMDFVTAYIFGLSSATNFLQDVPTRRKWLQLYQCRKPYEFYHQEAPNLVALARSLKIPLIPRWAETANDYMEEWGLGICDEAERHLEATDAESEPVVYKQLKRSMVKQLPPKADTSSALKQQRLEIACELYDQLTAGHETSAVALTYLYWELSRNPELQTELRTELRTLSPRISCTPKGEELPELPLPKDIDSLPLLNAVVMETLRLHAPIPGIQPRITPEPSATLAGFEGIPPNTRVNAQAYSLHRNPEVFPAPESWLPQRWLQPNDSAELETMRRWFWAFGSGGRMCIGSNLALQGESTHVRNCCLHRSRSSGFSDYLP